MHGLCCMLIITVNLENFIVYIPEQVENLSLIASFSDIISFYDSMKILRAVSTIILSNNI